MIGSSAMLFSAGCCSVCGVVIPPLKWTTDAQGVYKSAREIHFAWHYKNGDCL